MLIKVGIILINYQDYATRFLVPCRNSLRAQTYLKELINIYIVDNASTPESRAFLKTTYPEAQILMRSDGNYAAAGNLGFKQAIADGCQYLVTVNMDTEMAITWLEELVIALNNNPEAGIAQSKILLFPHNEEDQKNPRLNSLGNIIHFLGFGFTSNYGEADREIRGYPLINGYASGCSFIIRSKAYLAASGYNEEMYMYHDDLELSLKVRLANYNIVLAPRSRIFHKYEFTRSTKMIYYMERNRLLMIACFYPGFLILLISPWLLIMELGLFFYAAIYGWFWEKVRASAYFLVRDHWSLIFKQRRQIKKNSHQEFSKLAVDFTGTIDFQEIANPLLQYFVNPLSNLYWRLIKKII